MSTTDVKKKKKKKPVDSKKYTFDNNSSSGARNFMVIDSPVTPQKVEKKNNFKKAVLGEKKDSSDEEYEEKNNLNEPIESESDSEEEQEIEEKKKRKHERKKSLFSEMNDEIFGDFSLDSNPNQKPKPKLNKPKRAPIQINVPKELDGENEIQRHNSGTIEKEKSTLEKLQNEQNLSRPSSLPANNLLEKKKKKKDEDYNIEEDLAGSTFFMLSGKQKDVVDKKVNFGLIGKRLDEKTDKITLRKKIKKKEGYLFKKSSDGERAHKRYVVAEKDKKKDRILFSIYKTEMDYKKEEAPIQECYIHEELSKDNIDFKTLKRSVTVDKKTQFFNCFHVVPDRDDKKKFTLWTENEKTVNEWMYAIHSMLLFDDSNEESMSKPKSKKKNFIAEIFDL
eukprot:gene2261-2435_t